MARLRKTITLVLGGARRGKSRFAPEPAAESSRVAHVATARPHDGEMLHKVAHHRGQRPSTWNRVETPLHLAGAIRSESGKANVVLIDCFMLLVPNAMQLNLKAEAELPTSCAHGRRLANAEKGTRPLQGRTR
jgi:adenosyl cobinamide kinase/adenosyl cobinamide phosphate guanylyltransferase